jgi:hypothetical protein
MSAVDALQASLQDVQQSLHRCCESLLHAQAILVDSGLRISPEARSIAVAITHAETALLWVQKARNEAAD